MWVFVFAFVVIVIGMILSVGRKTPEKSEVVDAVEQSHPEIDEERELQKEKIRQRREAKTILAIRYQEEIDKGWQQLVELNEPVTTVSVSKIGHEDKYHFYDDINGVQVGDKATVELDLQGHENGEAWREAYVVSINDSEIGELTEGTIEKIEQFVPIHNAAYAVAQVKDDGDRATLKLAVYNGNSEIPGHRVWSMDLRGTNHDGRDVALKENGAGVCKLEPTTYENEPAIRVLDVLDRELGWVPKEYAAEVTKHINNGKISKVYVDNIRNVDDKVFAKLFLVIKNYL